MNVSGHRISTTEVESALVSHPSVAEAAVVGRTDPITGQAIFSYVILRSGFEASDGLGGELREHVAEMIGKFARPKQILFTPSTRRRRAPARSCAACCDIAEQRDLGDDLHAGRRERGQHHSRAVRDRRGGGTGEARIRPGTTDESGLRACTGSSAGWLRSLAELSGGWVGVRTSLSLHGRRNRPCAGRRSRH